MTWLAQSRKAQIALGSLLTILLSRLLPRLGFSADDVNTISTSILVVAGVWIAGVAHEDAAAKKSPENQTNVNSDVVNTPAPVVATTPAHADPFTPDQLDFIYSQIRQRAQRAAHPPVTPVPHDAPKGT